VSLIVIGLLCFSIVSVSATQVQALVENLLSNHGFEDGSTSWIVSPGCATYTTDASAKVSGSFSAKGVEPFGGSLGKFSQDVTGKVTSGRQYQISGWIKTQDVTGGGGAAIGLSWVDSIGYTPADGHIGGATLGLVTGTTEWAFFQSITFTVPPRPSDCVALYFSLDFSDAAGIAWWDDLSLTEVSLTGGYLQILEPMNESVIMGPATIAFVIENTGDEVEFFQGDPSNRIDLEIEYSFTEEGSYIQFKDTFSSTHTQVFNMITRGTYKIFVRCEDIAGNTDSSRTRFKVKIDRQTPQIIRVYNEGRLKIITNEDAECVYGLENCFYQWENATKMTGILREHGADWEQGRTYYIKCKDLWDNKPGNKNNGCSIIVKAV